MGVGFHFSASKNSFPEGDMKKPQVLYGKRTCGKLHIDLSYAGIIRIRFQGPALHLARSQPGKPSTPLLDCAMIV